MSMKRKLRRSAKSAGERNPRPMSDNKYIKTAWERFERLVVPTTAGANQRDETRKAFFAGASVLFTIMTQGVSDVVDGDLEPTEDDMALMNDLDAEIREFGQELDAAWMRARSKGSA